MAFFGVLLGGLVLAAAVAQAQDETYTGVTGGTMNVTGNLFTDGFNFTHKLPDSTTVAGGLFVPDLSNYALRNDNVNFTSVTVTGITTAAGDVWAGNVTVTPSVLGGITFVDNNDELNAGVDGAALNVAQGNGQIDVDAHALFTLTDNSTGNSLVIRPSDFTLSLVGNHHAGAISLLGTTEDPTSYNGGNLTLDFSDTAAPFMQLFAPGGSGALTGNASAATLNFARVGGNGLSLGPTGQAIAFSSGFVINGNSTSAPFGTMSVALGNNALANGSGSVASGNGSASGNLAVALGNNSLATSGGAVALAGGAASGNNAVAVGMYANAAATGSAAIGSGVSAQTWGTVVVGQNNRVLTGNATAWASSDPAFIVGVAANSTSGGKNGLVIYNNGNLTLGGPANLVNGADTLLVNGSAVFNGQATFSGNVLLTQPRGDISPGIYSH